MINDQVDQLRRIKQSERLESGKPSTKRSRGVVRLCVTSGKGGVGKSNFALNTSICLANLGQKVLLVDADTNLANLDILLGLNTAYNLSDVMTGDKTMAEIVVPGPGGIDILPGSSGVIEMVELDDQVQQHLIDSFSELEQQYNYLIIDTGAGLTPHIIAYATSADEVIIITNPELTAIADAYAMIKVISHRSPTVRIHLLVNMVRSAEEASDVFDRLNLVVQNFLSVPVDYLGHLPMDPNVGTAVAHQVPFVLEFPRCSASAALRMTTRKLLTGSRQKQTEKDRSLLARLLKTNRRK